MGKKTPKAPNPVATSAAQTSTNVATANANTAAMNGNITTDDGTRTTDFTEREMYDAFTGKNYTTLIPNVTERLSAKQQAIKDQQDAASLGLSTLANKQTGFLQGYMDKPFTFDDQAHTKWATDMWGKLNGDDMSREYEGARSRLSNMGIKLGSEAYNNEMSRLERSQGKQRDQFALDSYGQDFATQQALRNQPINEITALMSGGQVSQPVFNGAQTATIPTTDNAAIINQNYANQVAAANGANANIGGILTGVAKVAALSDKRAKKNIKPVGKMNGQKVVEFEYKKGFGKRGIQLGLIAQDVEKKTPEAVTTGRDGMKRVNYGIALGRRAA